MTFIILYMLALIYFVAGLIYVYVNIEKYEEEYELYLSVFAVWGYQFIKGGLR